MPLATFCRSIKAAEYTLTDLAMMMIHHLLTCAKRICFVSKSYANTDEAN